MKEFIKSFINLFLIMSLLVLLTACTTSGRLKTQEISASAVKGEFTVFLYGDRFSGDLENVAILDINGDRYKFQIFAPDFDYYVKSDVPAEEAIKMAERFISSHGSFKHSQIIKIMDNNGKVIGYEFRPLYSPTEFGLFNVLEIDYWLKDDDVVIVKIDLIPELKHKRLFDDFDESSSN